MKPDSATVGTAWKQTSEGGCIVGVVVSHRSKTCTSRVYYLSNETNKNKISTNGRPYRWVHEKYLLDHWEFVEDESGTLYEWAKELFYEYMRMSRDNQ